MWRFVCCSQSYSPAEAPSSVSPSVEEDLLRCGLFFFCWQDTVNVYKTHIYQQDSHTLHKMLKVLSASREALFQCFRSSVQDRSWADDFSFRHPPFTLYCRSYICAFSCLFRGNHPSPLLGIKAPQQRLEIHPQNKLKQSLKSAASAPALD